MTKDQTPSREEVIVWAREAGYGEAMSDLHAPALERFAALVAAAEREACAKVCENLIAWDLDDPGSTAATAIRARKENT